MEEQPATELGQRLVKALGDAARGLSARSSGGPEQVLELIVAGAVQTVPGAEQAGVLLLARDGTVTSHAPSDEMVARIDRLQAQHQQGPCVTALWEQHTVTVDDLAGETTRWPVFAPEALASGVVSTLSFQLFTSEDTLGALNLYSGRRAGFDERSQMLGSLFASHAAQALGRAQETEQLHQALLTRDVIGQAKGILMERFGLGDDAAFAMLVRSSQDTNVKLVDVARWLTTEGKSRHEPPDPAISTATT
ncbi:GAF and ANTAR domain-containing protein [Amycolatopsis ultiminotia]|uniref:GAF and ANTAR domain-containing protein n=1 Tax=Amycolatopsis ultiminotia TaxID=543629 RepID=A0ABP6W9U0_9PSEU